MRTPIRVMATALLVALLATPALAVGPGDTCPLHPDSDSECAKSHTDALAGAEASAAAEASALGSQEAQRKSEPTRPVLYVPPNRGNAQARVGGATRGGHQDL